MWFSRGTRFQHQFFWTLERRNAHFQVRSDVYFIFSIEKGLTFSFKLDRYAP